MFPPSPLLGHNRPPRNGWTAYCWRRAHKAAWKSPPVEVVRRRKLAAAALGLTYRDYTAVLLDRGVHLTALAIVLDGRGLTSHERAKLAGLAAGRAMLVMRGDIPAPAIGAASRGQIVLSPVDEAAALKDGLAAFGAKPAATALVGATQRDRRMAEVADVARFLWRLAYFG